MMYMFEVHLKVLQAINNLANKNISLTCISAFRLETIPPSKLECFSNGFLCEEKTREEYGAIALGDICFVC